MSRHRYPRTLLLLLMLQICVVSLAWAESETSGNFGSFDLYRTPQTPQPTASDRAMDCHQLEREIANLLPQTYSYKPDFYNDPYHAASVWIGTTLFQPAYLISAYSGYLDYHENGRIISAQERIEVLRRAKAERHCFES